MDKKLYKSSDDRVLLGVCAGVGEYFGTDPVIVRLLAVVFTLMGGAGLIAYIIAAIIVPERPGGRTAKKLYDESDQYMGQEDSRTERENPAEIIRGSSGRGFVTFGIILLALGAILLLRSFMPWIRGELFLAGIMIALGLYFIIKRTT